MGAHTEIHASAYAGAFTDPVFQSQSVFRALMDAMARPGTIMPLGAAATPPAPLGAGAGAIALHALRRWHARMADELRSLSPPCPPGCRSTPAHR